jgi:endoglucanase
MKKVHLLPGFGIIVFGCLSFIGKSEQIQSWIRINQPGYTPEGIKVAMFRSKDETIKSFSLIDSGTKKAILSNNAAKNFGAYGPFKNTYRLNFSSCKKKGHLLPENR